MAKYSDENKPGTKKKAPELLKDVDEECFKRYEDFSRNNDAQLKEWKKEWSDDINFVDIPGEQWEPMARANRTKESDPRPTLEWDQTSALLSQIINPIRSNPPGVSVIPNSVSADDVALSTANTIEGLLRSIEKSGGTSALVHAFEKAVKGGFGAMYLEVDFESDDSMHKIVKVKKVLDCNDIRWDTSYVEPDGSDIMEASIDQHLTAESFKASFPEIPDNWFDSLPGIANTMAWGTKDKPIVTNFMYVHTHAEKLFQLKEKDESGGNLTAWESDGVEMDDIDLDEDGKKIFRLSSRRTIKWKKLAGGYQLESIEWPGNNLPFYLVPGKDVKIKDKRYLLSATRKLKDQQRFINYNISAMAERTAMSPRGHTKFAIGTLTPQQEAVWATMHLHNKPLPYTMPDPTTPTSPHLPAPEYISPTNSDPVLTTQLQIGVEGLKGTSGIYNPSLGKSEQDLSGVAINALQQQGSVTNADFLSHAVRVYQRLMNDVLDVIPHYYDKPRQMEIVGRDHAMETVWINRSYTPYNKNGSVHYDLTKRKYKVTVEISKSYETQTQQNADWLNNLNKSNPTVGQAIPDLIANLNGRAVGADQGLLKEITGRLKKTVPPQLLADDKEGQPQIPPQVQAAMQQSQQQMAGMQEQMQAMGAENQQLKSKQDIEMRKLDIEEFKAVTERAKVEAEVGLNVKVAEAEAQFKIDNMHLQAISGAETEHIRAATTHASDLLKFQQSQRMQQQGDPNTQLISQDSVNGPQEPIQNPGTGGE